MVLQAAKLLAAVDFPQHNQLVVTPRSHELPIGTGFSPKTPYLRNTTAGDAGQASNSALLFRQGYLKVLGRLERSPSKSQPVKSQAIRLAAKVLLQGVFENFFVGCNVSEQSHRRSKLQVVGITENLLY
jgi:hypothetical protein